MAHQQRLVGHGGVHLHDFLVLEERRQAGGLRGGGGQLLVCGRLELRLQRRLRLQRLVLDGDLLLQLQVLVPACQVQQGLTGLHAAYICSPLRQTRSG